VSLRWLKYFVLRPLRWVSTWAPAMVTMTRGIRGNKIIFRRYYFLKVGSLLAFTPRYIELGMANMREVTPARTQSFNLSILALSCTVRMSGYLLINSAMKISLC